MRWCELAWLGGERVEEGVLIEIDGDRIASVEPGVSSPPAGVARVDGLTLPGLANAHSHAFQRALRGRAQRGAGSFWAWRERMYAVAARLEPRDHFELARACFAEMALAGVTLVGEFHYLHHERDGRPYPEPNAMGEALARAAAQVGIRMTLLDACYLHGGIGKPPDEVQRRFSDRSAAAWAERASGLRAGEVLRHGAAIHSVRAVDPDSAREVAEFAAAAALPLHAHVSEQPDENEACRDAYGCTPVELLERAGALGGRFTAVHATHLTSGDIELLGGAGCTCCLCPTTERDLADGIGPARALRDAGAELALGSDSQAVIDPLEEARALELDERLASGVRGRHAPADLMRAATAGGYRSLGWPEGGRIEPGALADLVTVGLDSARLAGTEPDTALDSVVFAGAAPDVRHVTVGGRAVVRGGVHASLGPPAAMLRSALARLGP
ncbi:MAG: formimidoylglutamate deiminase [Thermoleophilaceae bacterium]|nr:formimidoylglutamate deiminase [Thermoleophilaceae bacterium]